MKRNLEATIETFPIAGLFTISRGSKTQAEVVTCTITSDGVRGRGECVPYTRYGETIEGVVLEIEAVKQAVISGIDRAGINRLMKPGAARNAVDCALWDLFAKQSKPSAGSLLDIRTRPVTTAFTLSLGEPEAMAQQAQSNSHRPLLKVKLGTDDDESRMRAVTQSAPSSTIIVDANEGWTTQNLERHLDIARETGIALIEQPLPAGQDAILADIVHSVPICADESVHSTEDLEHLRSRYDAVNIKLDKTGGLTEALRMKAEAKRLGFTVMVGCMVGTSLAMAPAVLLAQDAEYADLDGPLLLARDREPGLHYEGSTVFPPIPELWG